jgi:hypothetical protein
MRFSKKSVFDLKIVHWLVAALLAVATAAVAQDFRLESVGARGGFSFPDKRGQMVQGEAFADFNLPWSWDLGADWLLQTKLNLSIGVLSGNGEDGVVGTAGPALSLGRARLPLSLEAGVSPTLLSRHEFGAWNFGTALQFTSYVDLNFDFAKHFRLGYRFQHMSNAGLGTHNPGFNVNMVTLSYVF